MDREINTVLISTDEYLKLNKENEFYKYQYEAQSEALKANIKAVANFIRKDHEYGRYTYVSKEEKELLNSFGLDANSFDLTVGKPVEDEEEETTEVADVS